MENTPTLRVLNIRPITFEDNGSYEDILLGCFQLQSLTVGCEEQYQFEALATLLRDPRCEIQSLHTSSVITDWDEQNGFFENILCDASSIEAIQNSNHTLEIWDGVHGSRFLEECLDLNRNQHKDQVVKEKIARYYFTGEFDVSPFVNTNMALSVVPEVISMIGGDECDQLSAIFRMFKTIPELSYVRDRRENNPKKEQDLWTLVDKKNADLERKNKLIEEKNVENESKDKLIKEKNAEVDRLTRTKMTWLLSLKRISLLSLCRNHQRNK